MTITADGIAESLAEGELVLVPAELNEVVVEGCGRLMEVYTLNR